jgi:uncharacterized protein YecT (DUF1311 family)
MRHALFAFSVILGFGVATATHAASFDCAKAKSRSEVLICRTPELSRLDDQLMQAYRADLAVSPSPVNLTLAQRQWIADRDKGEPVDNAVTKFRPLTADEMAHDYADRLNALKAEIALATAARATTIAVADLGKRCVPLGTDPAKCAVSESGPVKGRAPFAPLWYQIQHEPEAGAEDIQQGVVVFEAAGEGRLRPLLWKFLEGAYFDAPEFLASPAGPLLWLPGSDSGTGAFNEDVLYHPVSGRWRDLDLQTWKDDLARRLPPDKQVWKGVPYDFRDMTVDTYLWRPNDGNCCPTAGSAAVKLRIDGDRLAIASVKLSNKVPEQ